MVITVHELLEKITTLPQAQSKVDKPDFYLKIKTKCKKKYYVFRFYLC